MLSRAREFRLGKVGDPYCPLEAIRVQMEGPMEETGRAPGLLATGGPVGSWQHDLTACVKTIGLWTWVKGLVESFLGRMVDTEELIRMTFRPTQGSLTVCWLVAVYSQFVVVEHRRGTRLSVRNLRSYLCSAMRRAPSALINPAILTGGEGEEGRGCLVPQQ